MTAPVRRLRRHRLSLLLAVAGLLVLAAIASAAISSGGAKPKKRPLASAVQRALTAPPVAGATARIRFTNNLIDSGALPEGLSSSPLLSGATGRAWVARDGRFRLELQSDHGDSQIVSDGRRLFVFDAKQNTLTTARLPRENRRAERRARKPHGAPTVAGIRRALGKLGQSVRLSGATPSNVAGRPAYTVTGSPRERGGLLGSLAVAWDAAKGTPLRLAVTARGASEPVLALEATDIRYGAVSAKDLAAPRAPGAKREQLNLFGGPKRGERAALRRAERRERRAERRALRARRGKPSAAERRARRARHEARAQRRTARALKLARAKLGDAFAAPATLAGRKREVVRILRKKGKAPVAVVLYGEGLGGIAVMEQRATAAESRKLRELPAANIDGASGRKLETALGTVVTWTEGGTRYTLAASAKAGDVEAAARALR